MYEFLSYLAADYMTRNPVTIGPSTTLGEAGKIFAARNFNGLPVVDAGGRFVGFLTKLDWLKAFGFSAGTIVPHYNAIVQRPIEPFMSRDVVTTVPGAPLTRILQRMVDTRYKSMPVLEDEHLVGIISREDIVRALEVAAANVAPGTVAPAR